MNNNIITVNTLQKYFMEIFNRDEEAIKAAPIVKAILDSKSPRISDIAQRLGGNPETQVKNIYRFLEKSDPIAALNRLFYSDAKYVLIDPTEIEKKYTSKTEYVGTLKDGQTKGFQLFVISTPYRGRALPFHFTSYSSKTINDTGSSRNIEHVRALEEVKDFIQDKILVMDREFSYETLYEDLEYEKQQYVIRLNTGTNPTITYEKNNKERKVQFFVKRGKSAYFKNVYYKGKIKMNIVGFWGAGYKKAIWLATNLECSEAVKIYESRMKIEESFKDLKSLLNIEKIMNKKQIYMEKMIALVLLAYTIGVLIGEKVRDKMYQEEKKMEQLFWPFYHH